MSPEQFKKQITDGMKKRWAKCETPLSYDIVRRRYTRELKAQFPIRIDEINSIIKSL